ncbi:hypothetical protein CDL15_Pgr017651 [Punica granatum]|uniref:Uncharacterized protein n=1 Tax=Punica granatum TaxID=22663 RepID=A0A218XQX4_PUNGR|nr:hypothetical protein CDL15_Pgr017651 [Punica granatum]PKI76920.1 hypothetical protein CRG98_002707 [Punica granatum]
MEEGRGLLVVARVSMYLLGEEEKMRVGDNDSHSWSSRGTVTWHQGVRERARQRQNSINSDYTTSTATKRHQQPLGEPERCDSSVARSSGRN